MSAQLPLDFETAKNIHDRLIRETREADAAYFRDAAPTMTDPEYDAKARTVDELTVAFPELEERPIGYPPGPGARRVIHSAPMQSLANAYTLDEIEAFVARVEAALPAGTIVTFIPELKIDGVSLALRYVGRRLNLALTRGDHREGEDVTSAALRIEGLPLTLPADAPEEIEIRGEGYMLNSDFEAANDWQRARGQDLYKTPRNAAAGAIRKASADDCRKVRFMAYQTVGTPTPVAETQTGLLNRLADWGFETPIWYAAQHDSQGLRRKFDRIALTRPHLAHDIDGVVVKVNELALRPLLQGTSRTPGWAIAWKFEAETARTTLLGITVQVGRSGVLTPVAELSPVSVGGVLVSRATLHNGDHVERLDPRIGDTAIVARAGDVIPKVSEIVPAADRGERWRMPTACPSCGSATRRDPGQSSTYCTNAMSCEATALARFEHLSRRDVLDIEGLGGKSLETLIGLGILRTPADLYRLHLSRGEIARQPGWGEKSTQALLDAIEVSRKLPLSRLIVSLGIREIGRTAGRLLEDRFGTLEATLAAMKGAAAGQESDIAALKQRGPAAQPRR
jgi:DNA ligase (NAD+)